MMEDLADRKTSVFNSSVLKNTRAVEQALDNQISSSSSVIFGYTLSHSKNAGFADPAAETIDCTTAFRDMVSPISRDRKLLADQGCTRQSTIHLPNMP
jgi:hypothetical protein